MNNFKENKRFEMRYNCKKKVVSQPVPLSPASKQSAHPPNCYCKSHYCSSVVADDQPAVTRHLIRRLNYLLVQKQVNPPPPSSIWKNNYLKFTNNTSETCFHLIPVIFFLLPFTLCFCTSKLFMWRYQLFFQGIFGGYKQRFC